MSDVTSVSADGKRVSTFEPEYSLNGVPTCDDGYMRRYDTVLGEWIIVKMPEPILYTEGQIPNRDKEVL